MTEQICKNCKYWEYEYSHAYGGRLGVGCCTSKQKYYCVSFGRIGSLDESYNAGDLPDDWYCSIETDEDDHCKYWEANDGGSIR